MNNKSQTRSSYRSRHQHPHQIFELSLTNSSGLSVTPLIYSQTQESPRMIAIDQIPHKNQVYPIISDFQNEGNLANSNCNRKDCMDRKFKAIQAVTNKSSPNMKAISPHKMDIVFGEESEKLQPYKNPCIHSVKQFSSKTSTQKDLLKQFKQIEEARRQLKSRRFQDQRSPVYLSVNSIRNSHSMHLSRDNRNPEKSNLYLQVKTRISKRYNTMFRKYADTVKSQLSNHGELLKGVCSARSIRTKKYNPQ